MDIFKTKNLFLATYLLASGKVKFLGLETLDYKTKLFAFSPAETAQELETEYLSGGKLPVKDVFAEYNTLKDLLFDRNGESDGEKRYGNNK